MQLWKAIQGYFTDNLDSYLTCIKEHIIISLISLTGAMLIGIFFGYLCIKNKKAEKWIIALFHVLRIIPSLAVLILMIPIIGTGIKSAVVALVLLAIPPILMNTVAGFQEVPEFMIETAAGLGMTERQILSKVKIPLALPMILSGMRIALVEIIATVTIAAKIGAGGLGGIILTGLGLNRKDMLLIGGVSVGILSVLSGALIRRLEVFFIKYKYLK